MRGAGVPQAPPGYRFRLCMVAAARSVAGRTEPWTARPSAESKSPSRSCHVANVYHQGRAPHSRHARTLPPLSAVRNMKGNPPASCPILAQARPTMGCATRTSRVRDRLTKSSKRGSPCGCSARACRHRQQIIRGEVIPDLERAASAVPVVARGQPGMPPFCPKTDGPLDRFRPRSAARPRSGSGGSLRLTVSPNDVLNPDG